MRERSCVSAHSLPSRERAGPSAFGAGDEHRQGTRPGRKQNRHRRAAVVRHQCGEPGPDLRLPARRMLPLNTLAERVGYRLVRGSRLGCQRTGPVATTAWELACYVLLTGVHAAQIQSSAIRECPPSTRPAPFVGHEAGTSITASSFHCPNGLGSEE
jgi:hypothetical protein